MAAGLFVVDLGRPRQQSDGNLERLFGLFLQGSDVLALVRQLAITHTQGLVLAPDLVEHFRTPDGVADDSRDWCHQRLDIGVARYQA